MIACFECDALYQKLPDTSATDFLDWPGGNCPQCNTRLTADDFIAPANHISFDDWSRFGLDDLLRFRSIEDLSGMVIRSSNTLANYLQRNQQSAAKTWARNMARIADAIAHCYTGAEEARRMARDNASTVSRTTALASIMANPNPILRAYAILGVSDTLAQNRKRG